MMNKLLRRLKPFVVLIFVVTTLIMGWDIYKIRDYRGGKAYISISPDNKYKVSSVYTKDGRAAGYLVTSLPTNQIKAIVRRPVWWDSLQVYNIWQCGENNKQCYSYTYDLTGKADEILLPPTLWQQAHAWLTIKIKGLENPQLTEVESSN